MVGVGCYLVGLLMFVSSFTHELVGLLILPDIAGYCWLVEVWHITRKEQGWLILLVNYVLFLLAVSLMSWLILLLRRA